MTAYREQIDIAIDAWRAAREKHLEDQAQADLHLMTISLRNVAGHRSLHDRQPRVALVKPSTACQERIEAGLTRLRRLATRNANEYPALEVNIAKAANEILIDLSEISGAP